MSKGKNCDNDGDSDDKGGKGMDRDDKKKGPAIKVTTGKAFPIKGKK